MFTLSQELLATESGDICLPATTGQPFAMEEECVQQFSASQKECLKCEWPVCLTYGITAIAMATTTRGMFYVVP